jgi:hypothetical protein
MAGGFIFFCIVIIIVAILKSHDFKDAMKNVKEED